ncbi:MAG: outer membrane protein transport protein [Candidatus Krumholzibacteriia bacterium]|nr:outer membrane protein transport protein [bacterium]
MHRKHVAFVLLAAVAMLFAVPAAATNGMDLEGYGPISQAMGGASMAFDQGSAGLMSNPATLGLLPDGATRVDVALGLLGPSVTSRFPAFNLSADSDATAFWMPAIGALRHRGAMTFGLGVFGQGGMGTEYDQAAFLAGPTGEPVMSQVSVGRVMAPFTYALESGLILGVTLDYVWGGMDLQMPFAVGDAMAPAPGSLMDFMGSHVLGEAAVSAGFGAAIQGMMTGGQLTANDYARVEFADDSDFTGAASGSGFAGKLGVLYPVNEAWTLGAAYHFKTSMGDWEADTAEMAFYAGDGSGLLGDAIPGKIAVKDFQWPATLGLGAAFRPAERWLLAADYKLIQWSGVMENFEMVFTATGGGLDGETVGITFYQDWSDQAVINLGAAYLAQDWLTLRAGTVIASNPIPQTYLNPLFPAIEETHLTAGAGLALAPNQEFNVSIAVAPEVTQTSSKSGVEVAHSQFNLQAMYSVNF